MFNNIFWHGHSARLENASFTLNLKSFVKKSLELFKLNGFQDIQIIELKSGSILAKFTLIYKIINNELINDEIIRKALQSNVDNNNQNQETDLDISKDNISVTGNSNTPPTFITTTVTSTTTTFPSTSSNSISTLNNPNWWIRGYAAFDFLNFGLILLL